MARKRSSEAPPEEGAVATETPETESNGNGEKRSPVKVFSYPAARDTFVQASIWERLVKMQDGTEFTSHDVTVRKRYKDGQGDWQSAHGFRGSELYAVLHALSQASAWILEARMANAPF